MSADVTSLAAPGRARDRLLVALDAEVAERGLATTVADVVRRAGTSRRTFYQHFADREEAYLALYAERGARAVSAAEQAVAQAGDTFDDQLRAGVVALLAGLDGGFSRSHSVDVLTLGERGLAARRALVEGYARRFAAIIETARPELAPLDEAVALAVVGGIHELVLRRIERGETIGPEHTELAEEIIRVVRALLGQP